LIRQLRAPAFRLLVSARFGPLFATQFLSAFNDNALRNALVLMIAYRADTAAQTLGANHDHAHRRALHAAVFSVLGDRRPNRRPVGQGLADPPDQADRDPGDAGGRRRGLAGSAAVLVVLLFAMGIVAAFFGPLKYAILPDLLAPGELLLGNALSKAGLLSRSSSARSPAWL
jgi:acyl-[acyl-carrier-protein]-phospholipid O-acyltransferase / long-chain-fatty-acid--[acyl-carrier-protein] ligase